MFDPIIHYLSMFMYSIYERLPSFLHSYGFALIIFTIIIRLALLPLTLKQYKSTARMQELQPKMAEIQKRYKNDKEKLNQELMKFYQENNYNPASGCLPTLIQLPILFCLLWVFTQPLVFSIGLPKDLVYENKSQYQGKNVAALVDSFDVKKHAYPEILIINSYDASKQVNLLDNDNNAKVVGQAAVSDVIGKEKSDKIVDLRKGMNFLGLNMSLLPKWKPNEIMASPNRNQYILLLILPILATVTMYFSTKLMMVHSKQNNNNAQASQLAGMQNTMLYVGPIMTLFFAFQAPAALSLYWTVNSLIMMVQQLYVNKYIYKKKEVVSS